MSTIDRRESMRRVMGGTQDPTVDARRESMRRVLSPPSQYVAGGPGGIPGAKDGLPTPQPDPWSFGAPGGEAPASQYGPDTIRAIMAFKKQVKDQGGDIDGKSDAEVLDLMRKFGPNPGATASDYQPQTTAADEFGRGLRRGIAYGLPAGLPGVEAMRENEQVQRAPEGFAGVAGQTLGGFSGLLDPGKAPENFGAIVFTGGVGRLAAGTLDVIGKNVAESLGKEAGARAVNMIREAIENAGQGGGMAALNELGNIPIDDWKSKPGESTMRVLKAAGIGAAAGMGLGAAFGAASKEARPVPRATLPERVFDRMLTADEAQAAQEGRVAMFDAANAYRAAPRANEMDPQIIAAARQADQMAMDQARASARAIDESTPAPVRVPTPAQETSSEVPEAQGQGRQEGLLSPEQPTPEATAPAVDSLSYADLRKRAKELGVFDGPKTKAALIERVKAEETNRTTQTYSESDSRSTQDQRAPQVGTGDTQTYKSGAGIQSTTPTDIAGTSEGRTSLSYATEGSASTSSSPNPTRQPWEMTREEWIGDGKAGKIKFGDVDQDTVTSPEFDTPEEALAWANSRGIKNAYTQSSGKRGGPKKYTASGSAGWHRDAVDRALSEGRPVPPEVLADYPDLAARAKRAEPVVSKETGATPASSLEQERPELESRYRLPKPIVGKTGAKIVGYQWMSQMEEGMFRDRRVSDWSRKTTSEPTGRDIVHVYWVQTPDGETKVMGVGAAQKALGMSESKLQTLAKREQQNQMIRAQQWDTSERTTFEKAPLTEDDANAIFRKANNPDNMMWGTRAQHVARAEESYAKSTLLTKNGRFFRAGRDQDVIDNLVSRGWTVVESKPDLAARAKPPTPAEAGTTPAGTAAGQVEAPKASGKPTDYPGTGQGTAQKEGSPGTTAKAADQLPESNLPKNDTTQSGDVSRRPSNQESPSYPPRPDEVRQSSPGSPRPETPVDRSGPSHDFTDRRVIDKPEPGEPEGPVTSARNAMMDEDRFALGLDAADGPERRSWQSALDTAVARKIPDDALGIAAEVNAKPRPLDDIETAGLVYKANELKNRHRELMNEIGGTKDEAAIRDLAIKAARIEDEFDTLSTALRKAGTEQGRALASRKLTLREDYSLVSIKSRAKAAAGRELTPAENAKFEAMSRSLEDASTKIASLEKELADMQADSTIKRHEASKRGIPKETREKIIVDLAANVRQLIESGCR